MKYISRFITLGIVAAASLFSACTNDDFEPGPMNSGAQVYFPNTVATEYRLAENESSVTIPVRRIVTDEAMNVPIIANDESGLFNIPSTVVFAAGEEESNLVITFDRSKIVNEAGYPISLLINDQENLTDYGKYMLDITISPWPWEELGEGKYRDEWLASLYGAGSVEISVMIHKHKSQNGVYMVEEMFGWDLMTEFFGDSQSDIESAYGLSYTPTNITIDCSDPTKVVIPMQTSGIYDNTLRSNYSIAQAQGKYGTLENGIITFEPSALYLLLDDGRGAIANKNGWFRIMLPGAEITDYSLTAQYSGMKVNADYTKASAIIDFTYGADATGIKYVFAEGDVQASAAEIAAKIANGTAENILSVEDFTVGAGSVSIEAELANNGLYTIVALPLDKSGKAVEKNAVATSFYFPGMNGDEWE